MGSRVRSHTTETTKPITGERTMALPFLDLRLQYETIRDEVESAVLEVLRSGQYILGEPVRRFESQFASYCGSRFAIGVGSGTDALSLALMALDIGPGADVVTVGNISAPTICAILAVGARPVLVDTEAFGHCMDPDRLEEFLDSEEAGHVRAIMPVHLYGQMAKMEEIIRIAEDHSIPVIVDAAQAHGVAPSLSFYERFGTIACFSMYPTKNLGACGDAGLLATNDETVADRLRMMRNYGEHRKYDNRVMGINSRLDDLQAAILEVKLRHLDDWTLRRQEIAARYDRAFVEHGVIDPAGVPADPERHVRHLYVIEAEAREAMRQALEDHGISTAIHYPRPIHRQVALQDRCLVAHSLKNTEMACDRVISLPLYPELTDAQVEEVIESVIEVSRNRKCILQNTKT